MIKWKGVGYATKGLPNISIYCEYTISIGSNYYGIEVNYYIDIDNLYVLHYYLIAIDVVHGSTIWYRG